MNSAHLWWQRGIVYQIYPRSFMDSNGDGVGDLPGIRSRLDYVEQLGVDAIWISPIFPSPMADFGYDVADYSGIHPMFGTLDDFDALVADAHRRNIKVLLDLVPNHSSDEHPWFVESRSSRDNPKRDWYIWRDGKPNGEPPNNWQSIFGGDAWTRDEHTGQHYLHLFHTKQPDLNWRNPAVREAIYDAMRFWFDRGVDGFRIDVIWLMIKDEQFRDNPLNPDWREGDLPGGKYIGTYIGDQPEVHQIIAEMRAIADAYDERVLIGEIYLPIERLVAYYGENNSGIHLPFNFHLITSPWNARTIAQIIDRYEGALPATGWPNWVLGNHDQPRIASRVGVDQARVSGMLLLTLRGTPTMYYGDELGMRDVPIPPELIQDPQGLISPAHTRDRERTPMQWDSSARAGFTTGTPWLPLADDVSTVNVAAEQDDTASTLTFYRRLIALRRSAAALETGSFSAIPATGDVIAYRREDSQRRFVVLLNLGGAAQSVDIGAINGRVALSTLLDRDDEATSGTVALRPNEGLIIEVA